MLENNLRIEDITTDFGESKRLQQKEERIAELVTEVQSLSLNNNRKELVIQTLQEKINNLKRRVVFLETDLYEMQDRKTTEESLKITVKDAQN